MISVGGGWTDPEQDEEAMAMMRAWFAKLAPHTGGYYDNIDFDGDAAKSNYGPAHDSACEDQRASRPGQPFQAEQQYRTQLRPAVKPLLPPCS